MIRPGKWCCAAVLALALYLPSSALAQSKQVLQARALFDGASKRYAAGDLDGALALYIEAYKVLPRTKILLNIARLEQRLGKSAAAANSFARYLGKTDAATAAIPTVRAELAKLDSSVGRLTIDVKVSGDVFVGANKVGAGPGIVVVRVQPGAHAVRVHNGESKQISVGVGKTADVSLSRATPKRPLPVSKPLPVIKTAPTKTNSDESRPIWKRTWMWTGMLTTGLAATGIVFGVQSQSAKDEVDRLNADSNMHDFSDVKPFIDRAESRTTLANVMFIAAGVSGVLTMYLVLTDKGKKRPRSSVTAVVAPTRGGAFASLHTSF